MNESQIDRAGPSDWSRIRDIRLRSLADAPDAFGATLAEEQDLTDREWRERIENEMVAHFLVTAREQDPVGIAVGAPYHDHTEANGGGKNETAGLFGMWVAPEARQRRIGTSLVHAVIKWAQSENYRRLILDVANTNVPAIRLYKSCGFVPTSRTGTLSPPRQHILEHEMALVLN